MPQDIYPPVATDLLLFQIQISIYHRPDPSGKIVNCYWCVCVCVHVCVCVGVRVHACMACLCVCVCVCKNFEEDRTFPEANVACLVHEGEKDMSRALSMREKEIAMVWTAT